MAMIEILWGGYNRCLRFRRVAPS